MNEMLQSIPTYMSKQISDMISYDPTIINLSIGEPYFMPPDKLYDNLKKLLFSKNDYNNIPNKYADSKGSEKLRSEIAARYKRLYDANVEPGSEVLITHGASEAIWLCILTLTSIGDEVIIADPSYMMYETAVRLTGRVPVKLPSKPSNNFCLDCDDLKERISSKTKLVIINSPENPTGAVYSRELIRSIHELAKQHDFYFVHDEVYDAFVFDNIHENIFRYQITTDPHSILINSFSKKFSMMGWRLGWLIGSAAFISNATKVHTNLTLNLGSFHQEAAACVVNDPSIEMEFKGYANSIRNNIEILKESLSHSIFKLEPGVPKGGFFLFPYIGDLFEEIPDKYKNTSTKGEAVARFLLAESKVAVVPGVIYGRSGSDYVRIAVAVPGEKVVEAGKRLCLLEKINA